MEVVIAGYPAARARSISEKEKKIHRLPRDRPRAGHGAFRRTPLPCIKITIIPRTSGALGYTMQIEEGERVLMSREDMLSQPGHPHPAARAAEEVVFGSITSGASNDIEKATQIAPRHDYPLRHERPVRHGGAGNGKTIPTCPPTARLCAARRTSARVDAEVQSLIAAAHGQGRGHPQAGPRRPWTSLAALPAGEGNPPHGRGVPWTSLKRTTRKSSSKRGPGTGCGGARLPCRSPA